MTNISNIPNILIEILQLDNYKDADFVKIVKKYPRNGNSTYSKDDILKYIGEEIDKLNDIDLYEILKIDKNDLSKLKDMIKMKPMRTESGVTTVTVLTKPYACPGKCIFCPNDIRMPKSYIATEPGAQRALMFRFDPYTQVYKRLQALKNIGHPTEKIELLILGGTWSSYPEYYQIWFISQCFKAMNDFDVSHEEVQLQNIDIKNELSDDFNNTLRSNNPNISNLDYNHILNSYEYKEWKEKFVINDNLETYKELADEEKVKYMNNLWNELYMLHDINSNSKSRCVGLVLETRSDRLSENEVIRMRKLGATKVQLGIQILNDEVSDLNKRGETIQDCADAFNLLRKYGFKIHVHMMPNLLGASISDDKESWLKLFSDDNFKPDEVKIYPTSLIKYTDLESYYHKGEWIPYTTNELVDLIAYMMENTPEYSRLTRIIRDIPSTEIEAGNKTTNLREVVEHKLYKENRENKNIRAREVKDSIIQLDDLNLDIVEYHTYNSKEFFLQYITIDRKIAGFLRLSLVNHSDQAMIREIHVYGPALGISKYTKGDAQHMGLGQKLIQFAKKISFENKYKKIAVISAIGTREYYKKHGFDLTEDRLYQVLDL